MLDCLVSYFGQGEDGVPAPRRYFCYHVIAGPGPTATAGVATVVTLAVHDEDQRCTSCQAFHAVPTGGPAAALAKAIRYLDAYHEGDRLRKVQSEVRDLEAGRPPDTRPPRAAPAPPDTELRVTPAHGK
jgi:hypothetical protein